MTPRSLAGLVLLALVLLTPRIARADWRDGCPAGAATANYRNDRRLGPSADHDATLTSANVSGAYRVMTGVDAAYFTSKTNQLRESIFVMPLTLRVNARGALLDLQTAATKHVVGDQSFQEWSGLVAKLGVRRDWFSDLDPNIAVDPNQRLVHGIRKAYAMRFVAGWRPELDHAIPPAGLTRADAVREQALRLPFEIDLVHPGTIVGLDFEYRLELIGCYAPFLHTRLKALHDDRYDAGADLAAWTSTLAGSVTAGVYLQDHVVLMVQYGAALQRLGGRHYDSAQRLRLAIDFHAPRPRAPGFTAGLHIDYSIHYDGVFAGVRFAMDGCIWKEVASCD